MAGTPADRRRAATIRHSRASTSFVDSTVPAGFGTRCFESGALAVVRSGGRRAVASKPGARRSAVDMDEDTIPLEAGIEDRAISLTKGCYVGQEIIIRVLHRGHGRVARRLVGLTLDGDAAARRSRSRSGDREVGRSRAQRSRRRCTARSRSATCTATSPSREHGSWLGRARRVRGESQRDRVGRFRTWSLPCSSRLQTA